MDMASMGRKSKKSVRSELVASDTSLPLLPAAVWTWSWTCTRLVVLPPMAGPYWTILTCSSLLPGGDEAALASFRFAAALRLWKPEEQIRNLGIHGDLGPRLSG